MIASVAKYLPAGAVDRFCLCPAGGKVNLPGYFPLPPNNAYRQPWQIPLL